MEDNPGNRQKQKPGRVHEPVKNPVWQVCRVWLGIELMLGRQVGPILKRLGGCVSKLRPMNCIFSICLSKSSLHSTVIINYKNDRQLFLSLYSCPMAMYLSVFSLSELSHVTCLANGILAVTHKQRLEKWLHLGVCPLLLLLEACHHVDEHAKGQKFMQRSTDHRCMGEARQRYTEFAD